MLREKPKLFTIGQFAALHGINKKTLMWYDEIGLFKPAFIHEENGYRLYSYYQSTELEVILLLRDMNVPIRDIQEFMKNRSAGSMADLLRDKISELDRTCLLYTSVDFPAFIADYPFKADDTEREWRFSMADPIMECNQGSFLLKISKDGKEMCIRDRLWCLSVLLLTGIFAQKELIMR